MIPYLVSIRGPRGRECHQSRSDIGSHDECAFTIHRGLFSAECLPSFDDPSEVPPCARGDNCKVPCRVFNRPGGPSSTRPRFSLYPLRLYSVELS